MLALAGFLLAAGGCSKIPWVGRYQLDMSPGVERAVALLKREAEENGTRPPELETKDQGIVLELLEGGGFRFTKQVLGACTVTTGTYQIAGGTITLRMVECDGKPLAEPVVATGTWRKSEVKIDAWGTFRR
jgi:hypothetical protein